jgi:primosomal protein N' (replication factor Y)
LWLYNYWFFGVKVGLIKHDLEMKIRFAKVILPLPLPGLFTYSIPTEFSDKVFIGQRVVVQFGKQRYHAALIHSFTDEAQSFHEIKPILNIIDEQAIIDEHQFKLWQWISDYYLCSIGEVMAAALPSALRLQSESLIIRDPSFSGDTNLLSDKEFLIWEAFEFKAELTIQDISKILSIKWVMPVIKSLLSKGVIQIQEELIEKFKPRTAELIQLSEKYLDEANIGSLIAKLEKKAPKQVDLLLGFISYTREIQETAIHKSKLLKQTGIAASVLQQLIKKEVFTATLINIDRIPDWKGIVNPPKQLNDAQQKSLKQVKYAFEEGKVALLHGVTSSGKTEIYIHLIHEILNTGNQVLYLLPEISLTTQIIQRLQEHFGDRLLIYHSRFNDQERVEVWNKVLDDNISTAKTKGKLIIGARSAMFLPMSNLGLVIVDEEHDQSYKQVDPAPRYNARDGAIVIGSFQDAHILLGSATPSIESYFNALTGKYALITLSSRFADVKMPHVSLVDVKEMRKRKEVNGSFSFLLIEKIREEIDNKRQVILFQNRRGFAPYLECANCSWVPTCANCDVSLTYHKGKHELRCHYCGFLQLPPIKCNACGDQDIRMRGFGTERIMEDLEIILPDARIARLDQDTTRTKHGFQRIVNDFEQGEIDILIGTQMVTKGLDFENVSLVGIINADSLMSFPDFRAHERGFQLLSQVSGRAGRRSIQGKVLIQTYNPHHVVFKDVINHDFKSFYERELLERYKFSYPPYFRLIEIRMKHKDEKDIEKLSNAFVKQLRHNFGNRVLGPTNPTISRVRNYYIRHVLIKIEKTLKIDEVKKYLVNSIFEFKALPDNRRLIIQVDVDPL